MGWIKGAKKLSWIAKLIKYLPEKYVFIAFGIRIIITIKKKIILEKVIYLGFSSEKLNFAYVNNFLENVKNGFLLILYLKKKGGASRVLRGLISGILWYSGLESNIVLVTVLWS